LGLVFWPFPGEVFELRFGLEKALNLTTGRKFDLLNRPLRTTFLLVPERFDHFLDFFDESALVTMIKIHPQTKQKHKEVQNKKRDAKK
jgi:hypothetical protein